MSNLKPSKKLVPAQEEGSKSDTSHSVEMNTEKEAMELFSMAKNRLLDVSNWDKLCGSVSGKFHLTDSEGKQIKGLAIAGDYLKIDVPGPGTKAGNGYDWVRIEAIEEDCPGSDCEEIAIKVRPAPNPNSHHTSNTAHFFQDDATSTFIVKRQGNIVSAEVHGRNEKPNTKQNKPLDAIRNKIMAVSAMLGFSSTQWEKLVKGLLSLKKLR